MRKSIRKKSKRIDYQKLEEQISEAIAKKRPPDDPRDVVLTSEEPLRERIRDIARRIVQGVKFCRKRNIPWRKRALDKEFHINWCDHCILGTEDCDYNQFVKKKRLTRQVQHDIGCLHPYGSARTSLDSWYIDVLEHGWVEAARLVSA